MADIELARHIGDLHALALEGEGGVAGDDEEGRDLAKVGDDVLADPVREILLFGIAAHIGERQDADRQLAHGWAWRWLGGDPADQFGHAGHDLAPAGRSGVAAPAGEVGALDGVERHR